MRKKTRFFVAFQSAINSPNNFILMKYVQRFPGISLRLRKFVSQTAKLAITAAIKTKVDKSACNAVLAMQQMLSLWSHLHSHWQFQRFHIYLFGVLP